MRAPETRQAVYKTQQRGLTLTCTESTNKFSPSDRDAETDVGQVNVKPAGGHRVTGETASFFFFNNSVLDWIHCRDFSVYKESYRTLLSSEDVPMVEGGPIWQDNS